jgi:hypothetical protein
MAEPRHSVSKYNVESNTQTIEETNKFAFKLKIMHIHIYAETSLHLLLLAFLGVIIQQSLLLLFD